MAVSSQRTAIWENIMFIELAPIFVLEQIDRAEATGVCNPVLLAFSWLSPHAMAIVEAVGGATTSPPAEPEIADGCVALFTGAAAGEFLRRCAGRGGEIVAGIMADHPDVDIWSVGLLPQSICYAAYHDGEAVLFGEYGYDDSEIRWPTPGTPRPGTAVNHPR